jgi:hypothetical protein
MKPDRMRWTLGTRVCYSLPAMLHYGRVAGLGPDQPSKRTPKIVRIDFDRFIPTVLFMS